MGTMEDIDTRNFGECRGKFLHARIVKIDITKPLRRGIKVAIAVGWTRFGFRYSMKNYLTSVIIMGKLITRSKIVYCSLTMLLLIIISLDCDSVLQAIRIKVQDWQV